MQGILKMQMLALALAVSAGSLTAFPASAKTYVFEQPVVVTPDYYQPSYVPGPGPAYILPDRPFSLHRFVGNAAKGALGAGKDVLIGPRYYDDWY